MKVERQANSCRWATPTMFLQWPYWLDAQDWPWSCTREGRLRLLSSSEPCGDCPNWVQRGPDDKPAEFSATKDVQKV